MLRQRHMPFKITTKERDAWLEKYGKSTLTSHLERDTRIFI